MKFSYYEEGFIMLMNRGNLGKVSEKFPTL